MSKHFHADKLELIAVDPTKVYFLIAHMPPWADVENIRRTVEVLGDLTAGTGVKVIVVPGEIELALVEATDASGSPVALSTLSEAAPARPIPDHTGGPRPAHQEETHNARPLL